MQDLLVLVPSRGRPDNARRLIEACAETCRGDTHLLFGLDLDDPTLPEYRKLGEHTNLVIYTGLRYVVAWLNQLAVQFSGGFRYIGTVGDDNVPRTPGWDVRVIESLERQKVGLCFGDDRYPRIPGSMCCHIFMHSAIVQTLGYMGPPVLRHMYVDPVWWAWGKSTSIEYLEDVVIEHMHYSCGKAPMDATYSSTYELTRDDLVAFKTYMRYAFFNDRARLRELAGLEVDNVFDLNAFADEINLAQKIV